MPIATANPVDLLRRLRRLPALPASSRSDLARLRALAASHVEATPDAESPDVGGDDPRVVQFNPTLEISPQNVAWFASHGGSVALNRALNAFRASQRQTPQRRVRRRSVVR